MMHAASLKESIWQAAPSVPLLVVALVLTIWGGASDASAQLQPTLSPTLNPMDSPEDAVARTETSGLLTPDRHGLRCASGKPCVVVQTEQPLRVLTRSRSALLQAPAADAKVIVSNLESFVPLYVYGLDGLNLSDATAPQGFYHVGRTTTGADGYLKATDALEWRQALILEFEHPGQGEDRRLPTLFFRELSDLKALALSPGRREKVTELRQVIASGESAQGAIAREPAAYADITDNIYIYPILEWQQDDQTEERARYLRVLTAVPGQRTAPESSPIASGKVVDIDGGKKTLADMDVDIVFVLDMTGSMQPYIDSIGDALTNAAVVFGEEFAGARAVRFGLVGYRDDTKRSPQLEFASRHFTPDKLVDVAALTALLKNEGKPIVARTTSDEWAEAVLPGVEAAIGQTPWSSADSFRIVAVIGDASGHEPGSDVYPVGMDSAALRRYATDNNIYLMGAYIQNKRAEVDWERARRQFSELATNPGASNASFGEVSSDTPFIVEVFLMQFAQDSRMRAQEALAEQENVAHGTTPPAPPAPVIPDPNPQDLPADKQVGVNDPRLSEAQRADVAKVVERWGEGLKLGVVDYLGSGQTPPADFTGWVLDNDLANPNRRAVGVRVMVSKADLDTIVRRMQFLLDSLAESELSDVAFFTALQDLSARAGLDIEVEESQQFRSSNLLPKWIGALPYKSEVLDLTPRMFEEMTTQDRGNFRRRNESKLQAYRAILGKPDGWRALDPNADNLAHVYPLDLEALP
jgi:serine/threonine-protein kinase PpkA